MAIIKINFGANVRLSGAVKFNSSSENVEENALKFNGEILQYNYETLTFTQAILNALTFNGEILQYNGETLTFA